MTKMDKWDDVFRALGIDCTKPMYSVTADQIRQFAHEEPRLMASFDSAEKRPRAFKECGAFLLPVGSDRYVVVKGNGFHDLEPVETEPRRFAARLPFDMAMLAYGTGETRHILHAYHSGLLSQFTGVREMYQTTAGKMRTGDFEFRVDGSPTVRVQGAGMEIDAGFEGRADVLLFEGKAHARTSFLVRQLYYPYRVAREFTRKSVRAFFFVADPPEHTYTLWEYAWQDPLDYEAIRLVRKERYLIEEAEPPVDRFEAIEPEIDVVPQADDFQKVADFPLLVASGIDTARKWAEHYGITSRQSSYYREASEAMGLVTKEDGRYALTPEGRRYVSMEPRERADLLAERILKIVLMNRVFKLAGERPTQGVGKDEIARMIERISDLTGETPGRRASSVISYFDWLGKTTGAVVVKDRRIYPRNGGLDRFA
jgi:hypothetical protein